MKNIAALLIAALALISAPAFATDTYTTIPHPVGIWDATTGQAYALGLPGQGQNGLTVLSTQAGTNNFTGTFEINGVAQVFPASGLLVGTTDTQTLSAKTLVAPVVNTSLTLAIGTSAPLLNTTASLENGAGIGTATLTNAPTAGNPTKWIPINDNGTTRYFPAW